MFRRVEVDTWSSLNHGLVLQVVLSRAWAVRSSPLFRFTDDLERFYVVAEGLTSIVGARAGLQAGLTLFDVEMRRRIYGDCWRSMPRRKIFDVVFSGASSRVHRLLFGLIPDAESLDTFTKLLARVVSSRSTRCLVFVSSRRVERKSVDICRRVSFFGKLVSFFKAVSAGTSAPVGFRLR